MTVLILDRSTGPLPPYPEWLRDHQDELVLFTERPSPPDPAVGYAQVRRFARYATSPELEMAVLALARETAITAIVAVADSDLVRAAALRQHLGVPGQQREAASVLSDLVVTRRTLADRGIPTIPVATPRRAADLYWHLHRWRGALRVRRRAPGWPTVAVLGDEADIDAFAPGVFTADLDSVPDLVLEPALPGGRLAAVARPGQDVTDLTGLVGRSQRAAVAALDALPTDSGAAYRVYLRHTPDDWWLVDAVSGDVAADLLRDTVRAQAEPLAEAVG